MEERDESDQLPEEQPGSAVTDDEGDGGDAREGAKDSPGGADSGDSDPEQATGGGAGND
jgi:hypothetical protein